MNIQLACKGFGIDNFPSAVPGIIAKNTATDKAGASTVTLA
jgi:hypothetical protein